MNSKARIRNVVLIGLGAFVACLLLALLTIRFFPSGTEIWTQTKAELEQRGEILDWDKFIPTPVPAEENLFGDPVAASLLPLKGAPTAPNPLGVGAPQFPARYQELGQPFELASLQQLPVSSGDKSLTDLAQWFAQWDESFAQLRIAAERRYVQVPGTYSGPLDVPLLNFVAVRKLAHLLVSRARVHLLLRQPGLALKDLETLFVLTRALDSRPSALVSAMIQIAVQGLYLDVVQDGLQAKVWTDVELKKIQERLSEMNPMLTVQTALREGERAGICRMLTAIAHRSSDPLYPNVRQAFSFGKRVTDFSLPELFVRASPAGWIRRNQANYALIIQQFIDSIHPHERRLNFDKLQQANVAAAELTARWSPHTALLGIVTPNFSKAGLTMARTQTRIHLARVACSLERFKLQRGTYPENLTQLAPELLDRVPHDIFTGLPICYRRSAESYLLYAHGPNRRDDGGLSVRPVGDPPDWVWMKQY